MKPYHKISIAVITLSLITASCRKENEHCLAPVASFTDTITGSAEEPIEVLFSITSSAKADATYSWDFNDGARSFEMNPIHFFKFGQYQVILVETLTSGVSDTAKKLLDVSSAGVYTLDSSINKINFKYNTYSAAPYTVSLFNTSKNGTSYLWDFGDGTTSSSSSPDLSHVYPKGGTYKILLTVTGRRGVDSSSKTIYLH